MVFSTVNTVVDIISQSLYGLAAIVLFLGAIVFLYGFFFSQPWASYGGKMIFGAWGVGMTVFFVATITEFATDSFDEAKDNIFKLMSEEPQ